MKKLSIFALLLSVCAVSSFAQGTPDSAGARRVAERDAAYAKEHPAMMHEREATPKHVTQHRAHRHHRTTHKVRR